MYATNRIAWIVEANALKTGSDGSAEHRRPSQDVLSSEIS